MARLVRQGGGIMGRQVAFDPPANTEPRGAHAPGRLTDRLSFSYQQHRLNPAIQPCLAGHRQRTLKAAPIGWRKPLYHRLRMSTHARQCASQISLVKNFWLATYPLGGCFATPFSSTSQPQPGASGTT